MQRRVRGRCVCAPREAIDLLVLDLGDLRLERHLRNPADLPRLRVLVTQHRRRILLGPVEARVVAARRTHTHTHILEELALVLLDLCRPPLLILTQGCVHAEGWGAQGGHTMWVHEVADAKGEARVR